MIVQQVLSPTELNLSTHLIDVASLQIFLKIHWETKYNHCYKKNNTYNAVCRNGCLHYQKIFAWETTLQAWSTVTHEHGLTVVTADKILCLPGFLELLLSWIKTLARKVLNISETSFFWKGACIATVHHFRGSWFLSFWLQLFFQSKKYSWLKGIKFSIIGLSFCLQLF